jgi:hypothetical protein
MKILFKTSKASIRSNLNDTQTAATIYNNLPIKSEISSWGEEIYFPIPVECSSENPTLEVEIGDIAYWPQGSCLCIFFGKTPASSDDKPKPASEVTIIGKIEGEISILRNFNSGDKIIVEKVN